jgi:hypothetical protein
MSDLNADSINNSGDCEIPDFNEILMQTIIFGLLFIMVMAIVVFVLNAILNGSDPETEKFESVKSTDFQRYLDSDRSTDSDNSSDVDSGGNKVINVRIAPQQGNMIDVVLKRERVPIDYWIFEQIAKSMPITDELTVYMTDLQDSTFSNQNARALIHEVLTKGQCGYCDTPLSTMNQKRVLINWIFNHSRFTSAINKRYRMYNLYKKYFPLPLEADDYEAPLLEDAQAYSTRNPVEVSKSDIQAMNYLDVPETTKVICADQLFIEQNPRFSLYCNGDFLQWNGERSDSYEPVVARYYMIIVTDPDPVFSYTSDGLIMIDDTNSSHPSNRQKNRFGYTEEGETQSNNVNDNKIRVGRLSSLVKADPLISWRRIRNRVDQKLAKLGELMVQEHRQESMVDGIQKLLNRTKIDMYQTFAIDIVIRNGEPYILKITGSPTFREYGSDMAADLLESIVERTKLMLRI